MALNSEALRRFHLFAGGTGGIDSWLTPSQPDEIIQTLTELGTHPLTRARLNQLLTLAHEAPATEPFFSYYWLEAPPHPYDVKKITHFDEEWIAGDTIHTLDHLYWGMYRFYVDALLFFGNIRTAYQRLRSKSEEELREFFARHIFVERSLKSRGPALPLRPISKDNRYLISEMACKSFALPAEADISSSELGEALLSAYRNHQEKGGGLVTVRSLLDGSYVSEKYADRQMQLQFSADDILDEQIPSEEAMRGKLLRVASDFLLARDAALKNTAYYLSMVGDLDVYVATSMRNRADFRAMADFCEVVFSDPRLRSFNIRHFDPTLSAAENHEDKGLIECLMVKCAKALVYYAGARDSYGKDAEAAMALSLGKPVIFHCDQEQRSRFYRDVHPLSRLIQFDTGVAVGAMVTDRAEDVPELLYRLFTNQMEYELSQERPGYLHLVERLTGSVVRLQTSDELLRETFWNHYWGR